MGNLLKKTATYQRYFTESLLAGNFNLIGKSISYALSGKHPDSDLVVSSRIGNFFCRAGTTDFMYTHYAYEYLVKEYIKKRLTPTTIFMDIGACIGDYSVWLGKAGHRVFAFEPVGENFEVLSCNLLMNGLKDKVKAFHYGLGRQKDTVQFVVQKENKGASGNFVAQPGDNIETVAITTLDDISREENFPTDCPYLIKIDAEGMEPEIIAGGAKFLASIPALVIVFEATMHLADIQEAISKVGDFTFESVDELNMAAIKK